MRKELIGYIAVLVSAACFGFFALFGRALESSGFNTFNILATRYVGTSLILLPIAALKDRSLFKIKAKQLLYLSFVAVFFYGGTSFILFISYSYIPTGIAQTLHFMYPVVVFLLCIITKQEKVNKRNLLGLVLSCLGLYSISQISYGLNTFGMALAVLSAFTFALYMISVKSKLLGNLSVATYVFYLNLTAGIFYLGLSFIYPPLAVKNSFIPILLNGFSLIVFTTLLATLTLTWGIKKIGSSSAAILCCLEPITAALVGFSFFKEPLATNFILGSILILVSTVIIAGQK